MKNKRHLKKWESQARNFFGDEFWEDILSVIPQQQTAGADDDTGEHRQPGQQCAAPATHLQRPATDVYRTDRSIIVHVELPGLSDIGGIELYIQHGKLVVKGCLERHLDCELIQAERSVGRFKRTIHLPEAVEEDGIQARYANGLLEITLPRLYKRSGDSKKRIPIKRTPSNS